MNVKRIAVVSLVTFLIGGVCGGAFAYVNHPANGGSGSASLAEDLKQAQANREVEQFISEQEKLRPEGLENSKIETGSKYTGITYNGENNSVVIATPQKEQGDVPVETEQPSNAQSGIPSNLTGGNNAAEELQNNDTQAASIGRVAIQNGSLNVRDQASTNGNIIGEVYKGDTVQIIGQDGVWYQVVTAGGVKGYVSATYIEVIQ
ncbi:MAG: SH3 domain-containing protein [Peptococcaceae bacterium]|nr:SH3 domain-containing protein [Peptococcaceae bacterium]